MYNGNNPTAIKSQQWLAETLLKLMDEKSYADISIKDICENADLSRQTFYNYFDSKEELFRYLLRSSYEEKMNSFESIPQSNEAISAFVSTMRDNPKLVEVIVKNNMGNIVSDEIFNAISHFLYKFIPHFKDHPDFSCYIVLLSGALTHFLLYYARNCSDMSEKKMTRILETFLSGKVFKLLRASKYIKKNMIRK